MAASTESETIWFTMLVTREMASRVSRDFICTMPTATAATTVTRSAIRAIRSSRRFGKWRRYP